MSVCKTAKTLLQWCSRKKNSDEDSETPQSHNRDHGSSIQARILDIERAERAERAALLRRAERLHASTTNAVLERFAFSTQPTTLPSPQPSAAPKRRPESSFPRRLRPIFNTNRDWTSSTNQALDKEDAFAAKDRSPSPDSSLSSVDSHTPTELREIPYIGYFTPTPPPTAAPKRTSRLPVLPVTAGGTVKEVADACKLRSAQTTVREFTKKLQKLLPIDRPSLQPPAAPRRTLPVATKVSAPKPTANRRGLCCGTLVEAPKVPAPSTSAPPKKRGPHLEAKLCPAKAVSEQEDLRPLPKPTESLSLCFEQLRSDDWEKKIQGCKSIRALAQHHPETLQTKLRQVCLALTEEVKSQRSAVACAATDTLAALHIHLGRAMDLEAETTGRALLLQLAQKSTAFIQQQANLALDALVEGCSPKRVISALLNTGLSHRSAAVRGSTAQHLQQLADITGEDNILTMGKAFAESFLTAVSKMAVDAAPQVRRHGLQMLQGLANQKEFPALWDKLVPEKDRRPLQKILQKMGR